MGGLRAWCDTVEREIVRRGIKGFGNVSKHRWQREGGAEKRRGGGVLGKHRKQEQNDKMSQAGYQ